MATCTSINRTWKAIFALIASRDIYTTTNLAYIYYLCDIARHRKSIIYHDFIPRLIRTLTCFVDLHENAMATAVLRVYRYLLYLPNDVGFKTLFPLVSYISFVLWWTVVALNPQLCDIPILIDSDTSRHIHYLTWLPALEVLRQIDVPRDLSLFLDTCDNHWMTLNGIRRFCKIAKVYQEQEDIGEDDFQGASQIRVSYHCPQLLGIQTGAAVFASFFAPIDCLSYRSPRLNFKDNLR
ncbi:hypothetical protein DFS33DRAFT_948241 [Desarmillaria ectypa]|nr:hypothetical protein DFS33DRAFT_948241 [Desarmillaria ectypa]